MRNLETQRWLLAVLLVTVIFTCSARIPAFIGRVENSAEMTKWVEETLGRMTLDQRIAQLMIVAVNPQDDEPTRSLLERLTGKYAIGGLIYNESDIAAQVAVTNYAQARSAIPLLITIDGEWGLSMRLSDAPQFPHNLALGSIGDDRIFYQYGRELARECRLLGIHVNYAPVLDVVDREGSVIGTRAYGNSPEIVASHGIAFAKGMEDGGVIAVAKHFPGHGSTTADSHKELPKIDKSLRELRLDDLLPFSKYINAGLSGMMVAHVDVPALDSKGAPATMSLPIVTDLLQKELGFEGLVFTDALQMAGAKAATGSPCVGALLAGNDILLMPEDVESEIAAVKQAVADGTLRAEDIDSHCRKLLQYKYALGLNEKPQPIDVAQAKKAINNSQPSVLRRQMASAGITIVEDNDNLLPIRDLDKTRIAVMTTGGVDLSKFAERLRSYADVKTLRSADLTDAPLPYDMIIVGTTDIQAEDLVLGLDYYKANVVLVVFSDTQRITGFADAMASPYADAVVWAPAVDDLTQDYAAQLLFGGCDAVGVLPRNVKSLRHKKVFRVGTGETFKACRLGYSIPAEVGFDSRLQHRIDSVCNYGVQQGAFPGCQVVVVRHGKVVIDSSYGKIDFNSGVAINDETLFGLASVSKATGTISAVMKAYDDGLFDLDDEASKYIAGLRDGDKKDITFRQLLYHETGMLPSLNVWTMMMDKNTYSGELITSSPTENNTIKIMDSAYGHKDAKLRTDILASKPSNRFPIEIAKGIYGGKETYDTVMSRIYNSTLYSNKNYRYSCLNFSLLADATQRMTGKWLNEYVDEKIFAPLGAYHTLYRPLTKFDGDRIAYTENDTYLRRQHIHGYVHDELAAFSCGVQGNAGLFSNANDLAKLFQMWLNGGVYGGERFLKKSTVDIFTTQKSPNSHRGLGFDKPVIGDPEASNTCAEAGSTVFGHTGFTGTCYWVDPENDMIYIFLSNRVSPTRNNPNFTRVSARSHINSILYQSIEK